MMGEKETTNPNVRPRRGGLPDWEHGEHDLKRRQDANMLRVVALGSKDAGRDAVKLTPGQRFDRAYKEFLDRAIRDMEVNQGRGLESLCTVVGHRRERGSTDPTGQFSLCNDMKRVDSFINELDDCAGRPNALRLRNNLRDKARLLGHAVPPRDDDPPPPLDASRGAVVYLPGENGKAFNYSGPVSGDVHQEDPLPPGEFVLCNHGFLLHAAPTPVAGKKKRKGSNTWYWCRTFRAMFATIEMMAMNLPEDWRKKPLVVLWSDIFPSTEYRMSQVIDINVEEEDQDDEEEDQDDEEEDQDDEEEDQDDEEEDVNPDEVDWSYEDDPQNGHPLGEIDIEVQNEVGLAMMDAIFKISLKHGFTMNLCSGKMSFYLHKLKDKLMKERPLPSSSTPGGFGTKFHHPCTWGILKARQYAAYVLYGSKTKGNRVALCDSPIYRLWRDDRVKFLKLGRTLQVRARAAEVKAKSPNASAALIAKARRLRDSADRQMSGLKRRWTLQRRAQESRSRRMVCSACPIDHIRRNCRGCGGSRICEHDRYRRYCRECGGSAICEHDRVRYSCRECGGASICEHDRRRSACKECGGGSICEHDRIRSSCKECGGGSICVHDRRRDYCKECGGGSICEHGRQRHTCKECGGGSFCEHGRRRSQCKDCGGSAFCAHGRRRSTCNDCTPWKTCTQCPNLTRNKCGLCTSCNKERKANA